MTHFIRGGVIDDGDDGGGGGVGGDDMYRERVEPVLVLFSDLYSEEKISVCNGRSSSCPAYTFYCLLSFCLLP